MMTDPETERTHRASHHGKVDRLAELGAVKAFRYWVSLMIASARMMPACMSRCIQLTTRREHSRQLYYSSTSVTVSIGC